MYKKLWRPLVISLEYGKLCATGVRKSIEQQLLLPKSFTVRSVPGYIGHCSIILVPGSNTRPVRLWP